VPVFTRDNQRIGKVAERRGRSFKVKAPFFQRSFWLPSSCLRSAGPGEPVLLNVSRAEVELHRRKSPTDPEGVQWGGGEAGRA
jgi:hypothetical protein